MLMTTESALSVTHKLLTDQDLYPESDLKLPVIGLQTSS